MDTVQEERFYYGYYEHPKMRLIVLIRGFRYLHNVADARVAHHIERGWEDGLLVSSVASCQNLWTLILDSGTGFTSQVYKLSPGFLDEEEILKEWIEEHWKKNYCITAMAGHDYGSSLVVMSKGTKYGQQCYDCSYSFPFDWIKEKWREGFYVTSMATNGMEWRVVMSQGAGFSDQIFSTLAKAFTAGGVVDSVLLQLQRIESRQRLSLADPKESLELHLQDTIRCPTFPKTDMKVV
ncbi:hypothetical protein C3L33_21819, partial [Rhododendron williamsianum]